MNDDDHAALHDAAMSWSAAGANVLIAARDGTKKPGVGSWERYKTERLTLQQVEGWPWRDVEGIGMVCGAVSGNIEMLELEGAAIDLMEPFIHAVTEADPALLTALMTYVERTPGGGAHFLYRVDGPIAGNTKLASRPREPDESSPARRQTLIETRGEGGWTVLAPSAGRTHPTGRAWEIIAGRPGVVATITETQRDMLHAIAASFDEMPISRPPEPFDATAVSLDGGSTASDAATPGGDYNNRATWAEILEPHGWRRIYGRGDMTYWQRPGKNDRTISASTGYQGDWLYVFTTSTEFDPERTYTKFGAYTILNHNGDHSAAAGALRKAGYGAAPSPGLVERKLTLIKGGNAPTEESSSFPASTAPGSTSGSAALKPDTVTVSTTYTDDGNAQLLVSSLTGKMVYNPEQAAWLKWNGRRWAWAPDESSAVQSMREIARSMAPADPAGMKWRAQSLGKKHIYDAVRLASADPAIQVPITEFDADPYILNTPDGVVNLLTGEVSPPAPEHRNTRLTKVGVDFDGEPTGWLRFLGETFGGNVDMIEFVQRLAGYSATGKVTHHVLPFLHGVGQNGKSVFLEVLMSVLGDYAGPAPIDLLLATAREDQSAVANLAGQRLVVCSEVGPNARFNEPKVKLLTGGDRLAGRFLYKNQFTFIPSHHIWLMGNHQPKVTAGGTSIWRRLRLVPFSYTVPEEKRDVGLAERLVEQEGPGILAWVVAGARRQIDGLREPDEVTLATTTYAEEEDSLGRFVSEECEVGDAGFRQVTSDVTRRYRTWCEINGERPMNNTAFGRELKTRFSVGDAKSNGRKLYTNIRLRTPATKYADEDPEQTWLKDD